MCEPISELPSNISNLHSKTLKEVHSTRFVWYFCAEHNYGWAMVLNTDFFLSKECTLGVLTNANISFFLNQNYISNNYFDLCFRLLPAIGTDGYYGQISLLESGNDNYRNKLFPGCT